MGYSLSIKLLEWLKIDVCASCGVLGVIVVYQKQYIRINDKT